MSKYKLIDNIFFGLLTKLISNGFIILIENKK